jgi:hypothetical protein
MNPTVLHAKFNDPCPCAAAAKRPRAGRALALVLACLCGCIHPHHQQVGASMIDDKVTTERVEEALSKNPDMRQVHVSTMGGEVTLAGVVKTEAARQQAAEAARTVHRVSKLNNEIQVRPQGQ